MTSSAQAEPRTATNWAWLLAIGALLVFLYRGIGAKLVSDWYQYADNNHGFLVPLISGWLVWDRRAALARLEVRSSLSGVWLLGFGLALLVVGVLGAELFLQRSSLVVVAAGLVLLLLGPALLRGLLFPLAFLLFMIPLPAIVLNAVAFPLQLFAARSATLCLGSVGIPALREGNVIYLAQTTLEVAEACSGIRSLESLLALAAIYGYLTQEQTWRRLVLLFSAIPIAVAANALRVSGTGVLAHYFGVEAALGFYHTFAGWLVFVVAFGMMTLVGSALARVSSRAPAAGGAS